jgi:hypothetical protein
MADHRAEQIIAAVATAVTGLTTTGANVERGQLWPYGSDRAAALTIAQGPVDPLDGQPMALVTARLEVRIIAHVKATTATVDSTINQIAKEVYIALMADRTLGLSFVIDTEWTGTSDTEQDSDSEGITARAAFTFAVTYRHSLTDPSTD